MQLLRRTRIALGSAGLPGLLSLIGPNGAGRRFGKMLSGMSIRLVVQMTYFVLLARFLGPRDYGLFAAATSTTIILSTLGGIGAEVLLAKYVSRGDLDLRTGLRCALGNLLVGAPLLLAAAFVINVTLASPGLPIAATAAICVSDTMLFRLTGIAASAHLAVDRVWRSVSAQIGVTAARLVAVAGATLALPTGSLLAWCLAYLAATALAGVVAMAPLRRELGPLRPIVRRAWLREGVFFALSTGAQVAYYEVDKPLVSRLISAEAAGLYAAATRIIDAASMPIFSIVNVMMPRFFRHGARGARSSLAFARRLLVPVAAFGLAIPAAVYLASPYVPLLLGRKYAAAQEIMLWLSLMPLITGCFFIAGDVLTSTGKQGLRSVVQAAAVLMKLPISIVLAQHFGLIGCVWAILLSSVLLLALTVAMVLVQAGRDPSGAPATAGAAAP